MASNLEALGILVVTLQLDLSGVQDLRGTRNPSSAVLSRIRDAKAQQLDTSHTPGCFSKQAQFFFKFQIILSLRSGRQQLHEAFLQVTCLALQPFH